jgi:hypothetical protein
MAQSKYLSLPSVNKTHGTGKLFSDGKNLFQSFLLNPLCFHTQNVRGPEEDEEKRACGHSCVGTPHVYSEALKCSENPRNMVRVPQSSPVPHPSYRRGYIRHMAIPVLLLVTSI